MSTGTTMVNGRPVLIPRANQKIINAGGIEEGPGGIRFYMNSARSLRYQHLPDYDPNESDEQILEKLNERFEVLRLMTQDAIAGRVRAIIASGPGGVGKTYSIDEELSNWNPDETAYTSVRGYMRMTGLFKLLYKHREEGELIKIDDTDSIFEDEKSLNMIKIACDTTTKRIVTYAAETVLIDDETGEPIPKSFEFKGTVIFITNLDFDALIDRGNKIAPHLEALITRSNYLDLMMRTKRDYLVRLFDVASTGKLFDQIEGGLDESQQNDVLDFIDTHYRVLRECSLRMALKLGSTRKGHPEDSSISWKRKAILTSCKGAI